MYHVDNALDLTITDAIEIVTENIILQHDRECNAALSVLLEAGDRRIEAIERALEYVRGPAIDGDIKARRLYLEMRAALGDLAGPRRLPKAEPVFEDAA